MSKIYKRAAAHQRLVRSARQGPHPVASLPLKATEKTFKVGDKVRVNRTGFETTVVENHRYGYVVEGVTGYYEANGLQKI